MLILLSFAFHAAVSQAGSFGSNSGRMIPMGSLGPSEIKDDIQGRFLRQEWTTSIISFRNSTATWRVPLLFDVYSNKLYFLENNQIMEFLDSVSEFTMILVQKEDSLLVKFRAFYPAIHQNTPDIFYEVMVDGQYQLLKCKAKTIYQYKEQEIPEAQRRYNKELYYAYFPNKQMVLIKKDKEHLLSQVPAEYQERVKSILESKKFKLKNEESLKELFRLLNEGG
jgi:hypothetical protein